MPRHSISHIQRKDLRKWYFSQNPHPPQSACITWFEQQYKHTISQSTISESLSSRFKCLDEISTSTRIRQREAQWPLLESILAEWENQITKDGLSSHTLPGVKKDKSRITLVVCTNCSGSDRLPLWFIGHAKTPRALRGINISAIGGVWKSNKKAWMTTSIMSEWLRAFYKYIGNREVVLCMDNFNAHISGIRDTPPPANIRIIWLPANSTSQFQPLDQGVIQNLKVYYRKQWLEFIVNQIEHEIDPYDSVTVLNAIRWCIYAWVHYVSNSVIYSCFLKSTIIERRIEHLPAEPEPDLSSLYYKAQQATKIQNAMSLSNFLNPIDENVVPIDIQLDSVQQIIEQHITQDEEDTMEAALEDVNPLPVIVPTKKEALSAVQTLLKYQVRQEETTVDDIRRLERLEQVIWQSEIDSQQQSTLDEWIM